MAVTFTGLDGVERVEYNFTTTLRERFFQGTLPDGTADVQVSLNGGAYSSNPDLITFLGTSFTYPNPAVYPNGTTLLPGTTTLRVRAVMSDGSVTEPAVVRAFLGSEADLGVVPRAPSNISVERKNGYVAISWDGIVSSLISGYHVYASTSPGGLVDGYFRINTTLIQTGVVTEVEQQLGELDVTSAVRLGSDGYLAADPLYLRFQGSQVGADDTLYASDFDEALVIPDTARTVRTEVRVFDVTTVTNYTFNHDRTSTARSVTNPAIPNALFTSLSTDDPIYYVVTAIYVLNGVEAESPFSVEVLGSPLNVTPAINTLPTVSRQQIARDVTTSILRSQPNIAVTPGSVLRDTFIDPFATDAERMRFTIDFFQRALNFTTLLQIDDPLLSGTSIAVEQSTYKLALKQAFFLRGTVETQNMIDGMFDARAANVGLVRLEGRRATGEVTFYVRSRPTSTISLPIGTRVSGGSQIFRTTSYAEITPEGAGASFDAGTGRYSVSAFIRAESPGVSGNLSRGQITSLPGGKQGVSVVNLTDCRGGQDRESNRDLATRAQSKIAGSDSGTLQGYLTHVKSTANVSQVNVVDSGHPLMFRDLNASGEHVGGKVDIYVRGSSTSAIRDTFAFSWDILREATLRFVGDPQDLVLEILDSRLTPQFPLVEMLAYTDFGYGLVNATRGYTFDLTDVEILTHNTIQLSPDYNDPSDVGTQDYVYGDIRYITSDRHIFERQPAVRVSSFVGERTGAVGVGAYATFKGSDPTLLGGSTEAGDYLQVTDMPGLVVPSAQPIQVTGEAHVILEGVEYLFKLGALPLSVRIYSQDRVTEFRGPYDSTGDPDFSFQEPSDSSTPLGFQITTNSRLAPGDSVVVDYAHDENFTVSYTSNSVVGFAQNAVASFRHITADVLVKEALRIPVDIYVTLVTRRNASIAKVRSDARTALNNLINSLVLGAPLQQSRVIDALNSLTDVSYVIVPLTRLAYGDGAVIVRERVQPALGYQRIASWSTPSNDVFLLSQELRVATPTSGGVSGELVTVSSGGVPIFVSRDVPNVNGIPLKITAPPAVFVLGSGGMAIPGVSDLTTLAQANPLLTQAALVTLQRSITSNRLVLVLEKGTTPSADLFVTYNSRGDSGVKNLDPGPLGYFVPGVIDISLDEDSDYSALTTGRARS